MKHTFMFVALVVVLSACGDDDGTTDTGPADTSTGDTATPDTSTEDTGTPDGGGDGGPTMAVTLTFAAKVGEEEFACGADYDGIGTTDAMITTSDFRFYVYDVRLVTDADEEVPVVIADDGMWALDGTVLLDFEDGTSGCDSGNSALNSTVSGTVAEGTYTGVRFRMGVPFAQNHNIDAATAPPPLNVTSMWWNWQGGYKFLRIDGSSSGIAGWRQHLGSAGCDGSPAGGVTMCTHPNIVAVELDGFDAVTHTIVADLALLLADTDIDTNTEMTPPGCMASLDDPDCAGVFAHLGLDYMGVPGVAQTFFRLE